MKNHSKNFKYFKKSNRKVIEHYTCGKNEKEAIMELTLNRDLCSFYNKTFDDDITYIGLGEVDRDIVGYGYIADSGYYVLRDVGLKQIRIDEYENNYGDILKDLMISMVERKAKIEFLLYYNEIKKKYKDRSIKGRMVEDMHRVEYTLSKLNKYFGGKIPESFVAEATEEVNERFNMNFSYNYETGEFEKVDSKVKRKSLK